MDNELYRKILVRSVDSADGESATCLAVTEEKNCYAIWEYGYFGRELIKWFPLHKREDALEFAIQIAPERTIEAKLEADKARQEV